MKLQIVLLALLVLALVAFGVGYLTSFTVNENEFVIVTEFGKTVKVVDEPGLHFKKPGFMQTVNRLDRRLHIFKSQPITLMLRDRNPIIIACMICWRITEPELFFRRVKDVKNANLKLSDMINNQLGAVLGGGYDLQNMINVNEEEVRLEEIENNVARNTQAVALKEYGVAIDRVGIRRLAYPAIVENSVYNRMRAEREKEAKKYRAEGRQKAAEIEADTDLKVKRIMAEAYRDAEKTKGKGEQEAMRIYAEAYGQDRNFFEFLESLKIYRQTLQENTTLILSTGSELFKHLDYRAGGDGAIGDDPASEDGAPVDETGNVNASGRADR